MKWTACSCDFCKLILLQVAIPDNMKVKPFPSLCYGCYHNDMARKYVEEELSQKEKSNGT